MRKGIGISGCSTADSQQIIIMVRLICHQAAALAGSACCVWKIKTQHKFYQHQLQEGCHSVFSGTTGGQHVYTVASGTLPSAVWGHFALPRFHPGRLSDPGRGTAPHQPA